jgi:DNA-binding MarR family transcriptional regulator
MSHLENRMIARKTLEIIPVVMRVMGAQLRDNAGLNNSAHVPILKLLTIVGQLTLTDIAAKMRVSLPTMSNTISTLEDKGYVHRTRSEADRRVVWIDITPQGRAAYQAMEHEMEARIAALLGDLSPDERETLERALTLLSQAFESGLARDPNYDLD